MNPSNTTDCVLWVEAGDLGGTAMVSVWSDSEGVTMVASGDREGSGEIALAEEGGSGISGVVQWDGNPISGASGGLDAKLECPA